MHIVRIDEGQLADERMEQIIAVLKEKNIESIKALFSEKALSEIDNFENDFDSFFEFFQGTIITWKRDGLAASTSIRDGKKSVMIRYEIIISTDVGDYSLFVIDYNTDTISPDNEGVYMLEISKHPYDGECGSWQERMMPGIKILK